MNIILAKCNQGQKKKGVEKGCNLLRTLFTKKCKIIPNYKFNSIQGYEYLYNTIIKTTNKIPLVIGGDHSIGHSTVSASLKKYNNDLLVLWIDAHADINTYESSISKNSHGMPLSGLMGFDKHWFDTKNDIPLLKPHQLVYFGIRDMDDFEKQLIENNKIQCFNSLNSLLKYIKSLPDSVRIHVSWDVDSLDPSYCDSTGTIAPNGLKPNDINHLLSFIIKRNQLIALDIVEFNPSLGNVSKSFNNIKKCIPKFLL